MTEHRNTVTIRDVAARAGVSVSTVSLALNHPERVSAGTRDRVLAASDALAFVPKEQAVARARRSARRIGVIGPFSTYPAAAARLSGVLVAARGEPLDVVVFDEPSSATSTAPLLAGLPRSGRLDGLLVVSLPLDDVVVERIQALRLPAVLVDTRHPRLSSVTIDDGAGGELAAAHLLGRGRRRFAFLGEATTADAYTPPARRRLDGFRRALHEAGGRLAEERVRWTRRDLDAARDAAAGLLDGAHPPDAVLASDDLLAAAVLRAARARGMAVPDDVAVVGYDDTETAQALGLTTVRQPLARSGAEGLRVLRDRMRGETGPLAATVLRPELVVRDT